MLLEPTADVRMTGEEFNQMQTDLDKAREAYEEAARRNLAIPKLLAELESVRTDLLSEQAINSTLLKRSMFTSLSNSAYTSCKTDLVNSKQILRATTRIAEQYQSECTSLKEELKQAYDLIELLKDTRYAGEVLYT